MKSIVDNIYKIFKTIQDKPLRLKELLPLLKEELNNLTPNNKCLGIVTSRPGNDPFYAIVIPVKYECLKNFKNVPTDYYVDLDLNSVLRAKELGGVSAGEITAWLLHEICHNILTSTAKIRLQKLLYNANNEQIEDKYMKMLKDDTTSFFWCDIHSRTYKEFITGDILFEADRALMLCDIVDEWNSILRTYIDAKGGNDDIISIERAEDADKGALKLLNTVIRENYTVRDMAYGADIQMMNRLKEYVSKNVGSKLIRKFLSFEQDKNPYVEFDECDVNKKFDDSCLQAFNTDKSDSTASYDLDPIHESSSPLRTNKIDYNSLDRRLDRINFELEDVRFVDDKISIGVEIRDLERKIDKLLDKYHGDEILLEMKSRLIDMMNDLKEIKLHRKQYGVFINPESIPEGYEG